MQRLLRCHDTAIELCSKVSVSTTVEACKPRLARMHCLRTWLAWLLMALVPLHGAAAAAKLCCLGWGHARPAVEATVGGPHAAGADADPAYSLVPHRSAVHAQGAAWADCAVCASLCHSLAIAPATPAGQLPVLVDEHPPYVTAAAPSPVLAVPDKPPRS